MIEEAYGAEPSNLVQVFCDHVASGESDWSSLVRKLESKQAVDDEELEKSAEFQTCVSENVSFFSMAEFVWKGREILREEARRAQGEARPGVQVALADTDFELPLVGTISVGNSEGTLSRAVDPYGYDERSKRYDELWDEFLKNLKDRLESRTGDRQVARNTP